MRGRLGCAVALVLALAGCGATQHTQTTTTTTSAGGAGQGPTVHFTGGSLPGTVYLGVGPDELSLDAYRLSGPLPEAKRLTYSPVGLGIEGLGASQRYVVIQRVCCGGLMFMEELNLTRRGGLPGTVLGSGGAAGIAPDGQFAHVVQNYPGCDCDVLMVRPTLLGTDRIIYRDRHPGTILSDVWSVNNRLAALIATTGKDGLWTNTEILLYPGTSQAADDQTRGDDRRRQRDLVGSARTAELRDPRSAGGDPVSLRAKPVVPARQLARHLLAAQRHDLHRQRDQEHVRNA